MTRIKPYSILLIFILSMFSLYAKNDSIKKMQVSGYVRDFISKEALIGANVYSEVNWVACATDEKGYFSLSIPVNTDLNISYVGYKSKKIKLGFNDTILSNIFLEEDERVLDAVTIRNLSVKRNPGLNIMSMDIVNILPSVTGKPDVIKSLQYYPGFAVGTENSSTLMVRGGNPGENLYMLDNIPLIHVNHLSGYFSVFNPDMINKLYAYKGNFPARYSGKLSSVINVVQKEGGKTEKPTGTLSVGLSDISFTVEGKMTDNSSFIIGGRKTLIDLLYAITTTAQNSDPYSRTTFFYGFHDINAKFSWDIDEKNSMYFNIFYGDDYLPTFGNVDGGKIKHRASTIWGNVLASSHWRRIISPKLIMENSLSFTRYRYKNKVSVIYEDGEKPNINTISKNVVNDAAWRSDFKYSVSDNIFLNFGGVASWLSFTQGNESFDGGLYMDSKFTPTDWVDINIGAFFGNFTTKDYFNFSVEPRGNVNFLIGNHTSMGVGYSRMTQNRHLISVPGPLLNNEMWFSSSADIPTSTSDQYNFSVNNTFHNNMFEIKLDLYYKDMNNLTALKDGQSFSVDDKYWKEKVSSGGKGHAYGIEFLFAKKSGRFNGHIAYTYSRSFRQFDDINNGKTYAFEYDRPHNLAINFNFDITKKWVFSMVWVYQTGLPYTPAIDRIITPDLSGSGDPFYEALVYGDKNSAQMEAYHKLDVGFHYNYISKRGNRSCWSFVVSNVYNRQNPSFYYYNHVSSGEYYVPNNSWYDQEFKSLNMYKLSTFPIIPMFSYKVYFDGESKAKKEYKVQREGEKKQREVEKKQREVEKDKLKNSDSKTKWKNIFMYD